MGGENSQWEEREDSMGRERSQWKEGAREGVMGSREKQGEARVGGRSRGKEESMGG